MTTVAMTETIEESNDVYDADGPTGGRLVSNDGREMALQGADVRVNAGSGIARVVLTQRFTNPHVLPLNVSYSLPLPPDGAVSGFDFLIDDKQIKGEVVPRPRARERFEEMIAEGRSAPTSEQERTNLFTQEVGNIPPKVEVSIEVIIDQKLCWLVDGAWEWRFPTVVGPPYVGHDGADTDLPAQMSLALSIRDGLTSEQLVVSPSHDLEVFRGQNNLTEVSFGEDGRVRLDRDIVVRWAVALPEIGVSVTIAHPSDRPRSKTACGLVTIIPPEQKADHKHFRRDLIFLIDTSGSMSGQPLCQAADVAAAMIDTLSANDQIELIEFSNHTVRFADDPIPATSDSKRAAVRWVRSLRAGGATEMLAGIEEALAPLRPDSQRQIVLITDGYIGFEREIITTLLDQLPPQTRLHTVGVGSAINRSLTFPAARAGRGVEIIIGPDQEVEPAVVRLLARTTQPLVTNVRVASEGSLSCAPLKPPDLFAGCPILIAVELDTAGGSLTVTGDTVGGAPFEQTVAYPAAVLGKGAQGISALFARERVKDLETQLAAGIAPTKLEVAIERIGVAFQIATRLTSWIAVRKTSAVDPNEPARREIIAHELPFGTPIEGFGLRAAGPAVTASAMYVWDQTASVTAKKEPTPPPLPKTDVESKKEPTPPPLPHPDVEPKEKPTPPPLPKPEPPFAKELTSPPKAKTIPTPPTTPANGPIPRSRLMAVLEAPTQPKMRRTRRRPGPGTEETNLRSQARQQILWLVVLTIVVVALLIGLSLFITGCFAVQHQDASIQQTRTVSTVDDRS